MINVYYMAQEFAKRFNPDAHGKNWIMISITDPGCEPVQFLHQDKFLEIERFYFLDHPTCAITDEDAYRLHQVLQKAIVNNQNIAVHCFMGVSRSGAVAKYLSQFTAENQMSSYQQNNQLVSTKLNQYALPSFEGKVLAHPYDTVNKWRKCLECYGLGCPHCEDGKVRSYIYIGDEDEI